MIDDATGALELIECAHAICQCTLMGTIRGETYCSDTCRNADEGGMEQEACACGHPPCDAPL